MNKTIRVAMLFGVAASVLACGAAPSEGAAEAEAEAELGTTSAAMSSLGYWSWGTPGNNGSPLDLGSDVNRTCMLQGVTGALTGPTYGTPGSVRVYRSGGRWWLRTKAGDGPGVMGHATCIPTANNRHAFTWYGNTYINNVSAENAVTYTSTSPSTECFLTELESTLGFERDFPHVTLTKSVVNGVAVWKLGGSLQYEPDGTAGGRATATCVDMFQSVTPFAFQNTSSLTTTSPPIAPVSGTTCGLTKLRGMFYWGHWEDGARIFPENGSWKAFANGSERIEGRCYSNIILNPF